jgi:hypothetical protein
VFLVPAYNLEWFHANLHTDLVFGVAWGGFPVAVGFLAQHPPLTTAVSSAAACAVLTAIALSSAQRRLSTPARELRRRTVELAGVLTRTDGSRQTIDADNVRAPLEAALKSLCWAVPLLALTLLLLRHG